MKEPRGKDKTESVQPVLPAELLNFLSRRSYSLLIKGEAATGKTILALSILKGLGKVDDYLYLSTRVSPSQLFENHPWLSQLTKAEKPNPMVPAAVEQAEGAEEQANGQERFVDARLDEPVPFFERITNELMDVRSPTIVVDSWDPIGMLMETDALVSNTKVLQTWRERAEASLITLVEDSSNTAFDSLFDGVVSLDRYYDDGRIVRMIQLSKLSGVKVNRPSYLFTLDGGVFQSFRTYNPLEMVAKNPGGWSWEHRSRSTGYRELDAVLDGTLPSGTIMNLNLAAGVNSGMVLLVLGGVLGHGASRSKSTLFKPFGGVGLEQARGALGEVVVIQQPRRGGAVTGGVAESLKAQVGRERKTKRGQKVVLLAGSEFFLSAGEEEDVERLLEVMKSDIDLSVIVSGSEDQSDGASRISDVSLKLSDLNGTPLLQAQLPWTEYFAVNVKADHAPARVSLVPMV
jgi:KaiC/GvpD/RAD55 family RecA-like ATPase